MPNLDLHVDLGAVLVAVLDGVHHGLADRSLEPLEPGRLQTQLVDCRRHLGDSDALISLFAGYGELGQDLTPILECLCRHPEPRRSASRPRA